MPEVIITILKAVAGWSIILVFCWLFLIITGYLERINNGLNNTEYLMKKIRKLRIDVEKLKQQK